jgi:outer membrane protein TolC
MPILDFGRTSARVDQAKALNQQSLIAWQNSLQTASKEVRDALVSLREDGEAETAKTSGGDSARKALDVSACATKLATPYLKSSTPAHPQRCGATRSPCAS